MTVEVHVAHKMFSPSTFSVMWRTTSPNDLVFSSQYFGALLWVFEPVHFAMVSIMVESEEITMRMISSTSCNWWIWFMSKFVSVKGNILVLQFRAASTDWNDCCNWFHCLVCDKFIYNHSTSFLAILTPTALFSPTLTSCKVVQLYRNQEEYQYLSPLYRLWRRIGASCQWCCCCVSSPPSLSQLHQS